MDLLAILYWCLILVQSFVHCKPHTAIHSQMLVLFCLFVQVFKRSMSPIWVFWMWHTHKGYCFWADEGHKAKMFLNERVMFFPHMVEIYILLRLEKWTIFRDYKRLIVTEVFVEKKILFMSDTGTYLYNLLIRSSWSSIINNMFCNCKLW